MTGLKRMCRCGILIPYQLKLCSSCQSIADHWEAEKLKSYNRHYDKYRRSSRAAKFYDSSAWRKTRLHILNKYNGLDLYDYYINKIITQADTVHHIEELRENWSRALDMANLIPISKSNHSKIHRMYNNSKKDTQELLFELLNRWRKEYED